ncbi:MAG: adenosine deaminase, partial [Bacteroidia bacterium]
FDTVNEVTPFSYQEMFKTNIYHLLALFKVAFTKYLKSKRGDEINVNNYIIEIYEKDKREIIIKTFKFLQQFVEKQMEVVDNKKKSTEKMIRFLFTLSHYEKVKEELEEETINVEDIENIILNDNEDIVDGETSDNEDDVSDKKDYEEQTS